MGLLIDGGAEDDRAPTGELSCVSGWCLLFDGNFTVLTEDAETNQIWDLKYFGKQPIVHKSRSNTPESRPTALITCLPKQGCPCKVTSVSNPALPVNKTCWRSSGCPVKASQQTSTQTA